MSAELAIGGGVLAYSGMLCFCLAMPRHWKELVGSRWPAGWQRGCRPLGVVLLALAGWICAQLWPVGMAMVALIGLAGLGGLALLLLLPYAPRLALALPAGGMLISLCLGNAAG